MRNGDKLRFRGPAGAPFVVTVGAAWTPRTIQARVTSGEWTPLAAPDSQPSPPPVPRVPARPPRTATRPAWTSWAVAVHGLTEQQAKDMTKAQLMELPDQPPATEPPEEEGEQRAETPSAPAADGRPAEDAPKSEWIDHAFRLGKGTREDLAVFTREDLIELTA